MSEDRATQLIDRARERSQDLSLGAVRRWKAEHPGGLAIGYLPIYVPHPLLEALGCLPVGIFGGGDQVDIIRGDSYYQSYICHIPRSVIELALGGELAALDGIICPSICDVIRNLSGMWRLLFPKAYVAYLDLPQDFDPGLGGAFYAGELRRIAGELTERGARPLEAQALRQAIVHENARRQAIADLDALRRREPWRIKASEAYMAVRAGTQIPAVEHERELRQLLEALAQRPAQPRDHVRVVVVGAFCEQPPWGLIRSLERAGCDIVADDFQLGLRMLPPHITEDASDPLLALALAFCEHGQATASRYIDRGEKGRALIEQVREAQADGVIFAAASFCDPALLDQPMLEQALAREGIPYTSFKYSENTGQFQVIREQAGAFSDAVKLWGGTIEQAASGCGKTSCH